MLQRPGSIRPSADLSRLAEELSGLAAAVDDPVLRTRLQGVDSSSLPPVRPTFSLVRRERDGLHQVAVGRTDLEAADALGILPSTTKSCLKNVMLKLGVINRVHAIVTARALDLID